MIGDHVAEAADVTNTVTAGGLAALMAGITDGSLLGADATATALDLLSRQDHRRHDSGRAAEAPGVRARVAGCRASRTTSRWCVRRRAAVRAGDLHDLDLPDAEGEALVARLSAITWEHWTRMARIVEVATARMARRCTPRS